LSCILARTFAVFYALPLLILAISLIPEHGRPIGNRERLAMYQNLIKAVGSNLSLEAKALTAEGCFIIPVIFAALAARLATRIAAYKFEQGGTLCELEQLVGSKIIWSTINIQYQTRGLNFLGIGLLFLWSMSPLGGQAVLRILGTVEHYNWCLPISPTLAQIRHQHCITNP